MEESVCERNRSRWVYELFLVNVLRSGDWTPKSEVKYVFVCGNVEIWEAAN
jgi:hypothetical protein